MLSLHRTNPALAQSVIASMPEDAQVRAQTFIDRAENEVGPAGRPIGPDEQIDASQLLTSSSVMRDGFGQEIQAVATRVAEIQTLDLDQDDIKLALWETTDSDTIDDQVAIAIEQSIPQGFKPNTNFLWLRNLTAWTRLVDEDLDMGPIGSEHRRFFRDESLKAFKQRKNEGEDDATAATNAKILASARVMSRFPPLIWNNVVHLQAGPVVGPEIQDNFEPLIQQRIDDGTLTRSLSFYTDNYVPRWSQQKGGFEMVRSGNRLDVLEGFFVKFQDNRREALQRAIDEARAADIPNTPASPEFMELINELGSGPSALSK